jgi:hypothetical protein
VAGGHDLDRGVVAGVVEPEELEAAVGGGGVVRELRDGLAAEAEGARPSLGEGVQGR